MGSFHASHKIENFFKRAASSKIAKGTAKLIKPASHPQGRPLLTLQHLHCRLPHPYHLPSGCPVFRLVLPLPFRLNPRSQSRPSHQPLIQQRCRCFRCGLETTPYHNGKCGGMGIATRYYQRRAKARRKNLDTRIDQK